VTLPTPAQCAGWYEQVFGGGAVLMIDPDADVVVDDDTLRARTVDALTTLRWISRPVSVAPRLLALAGEGADALVFHHGVDAVTGQVSIGPISSDDAPVGAQLARIGLHPQVVGASSETEERAVVDQEDLAPVLMFAVVAQTEAPGQEERERPPAPDPDELPLDIYASEFIGLATEFGAPLESIWHQMWEFSGVRWCLLNAALDVEHVDRIPYRQALPPEEFVDALHQCNDLGLTFLDLPVYVTTGAGRGHAIHIQTINNREVVYHDPWPGRSLLAAGNNALGITAQPTEGTERLWRITPNDLQRVGYAALVKPEIWLPLCGVATEVRYKDLSASDFFGFFHLTETGRTVNDESGVIQIGLQPGNWREHIAMGMTVDADDAVREAVLMVNRSWLSAPETTMFAFDLVTHFVDAAVPEADAGEVALLSEALRSIPTGGLAETLAAGPPHLLNQFRLVALAIAGASSFARATLPCSTIRVINGTPQGEDDGQSRLIVAVRRAKDVPGPLVEDQETGYLMDEYRLYLWKKAQDELQRLRLASSASNAEIDEP
jgi:hypothetical protein